MPFRLVNSGPSTSPIFPARKGILALRPDHRSPNIGGSMLSGRGTELRGRDRAGCRGGGARGLGPSRPEKAGWGGHVERLMWAAVVVAVDPGVDRGLSRRQVGEGPAVVEEFSA